MKLMNRRPYRRQRGVALLEVLVSVLLFSLGVLGLIGLQARAIKYSVESEDRNRAAMLANEIATTMWLTNSAAVNVGSGTPTWTARVKSELGQAATAVVDPVASPPNSADITLTWSPPQRTSTESATSQLTTRVTLPPPP